MIDLICPCVSVHLFVFIHATSLSGHVDLRIWYLDHKQSWKQKQNKNTNF